ncbi:OLC1v1028181C1 [Oldenlandia corymbosa var. corymbosa]|uniref:OLC1v1028181C1 n=1 Tax=Oldenlandia corymbosa var. corymbosa TaxID=529605 RepID=A0AAV1CBN7_OLDCO|nr:OLC1v1028181C1 [Oldenlandia corymbosa var. corymbosa]
MTTALMLRRGGLGKLRAFGGNFDSVSSILRRHAAEFSSEPSSPSSLSSRPLSCVLAADALVTDDSLLDAAKVELEPTLLRPRVVVYDGVCHLCHNGVKWVIEADKDKKINFCCLQSKAAEPYLNVAGVDRGDVLRRFLFVEGPGAYHQGSAAALRVMSYLPFPYYTLSSLMIVPSPLRDAVYDYVAKHRYKWFGKSSTCLVIKEKELLERFVDWEEHIDKSESDF